MRMYLESWPPISNMRVDFGVDRHGASGVGGDFVDDQIGIEEIPHHVAPRAGGGDALQPNPIAHFLFQGFEKLLGNFDGFSLGRNVTLVKDLSVDRSGHTWWWLTRCLSPE